MVSPAILFSGCPSLAINDWTIVHEDHAGDVISTFKPENLRFTLNKLENGAHTINYEVSRGRGLVVPNFIGPYRTNFKLTIDGYTDPILAGMHTSLQLENDTEAGLVGGKGWGHYLERRFWPYDDSDPNAHRVGTPTTTADNPPTGLAYYIADEDGVDVSIILTDILDEVLAEPNSLVLTYTIASMGITVDYYTIDLIDTENILSKITALAQRDPGEFDFEVDNLKEFKVYPGRQYSLDVVNDEEHADIQHYFHANQPETGLVSCQFTNTGPMATRVIGSGGALANGFVSVREYVPGSEVFYLLESAESFQDVSDADTVDRMTRKQLLFGMNPVHEITIVAAADLITDFWTKFKPGRAIWLACDLGMHVIDSAQEIISMEVTPDQSGDTLVTIKLNQIYESVGIS